jgi:hypothetical protein
MTLVQLLVVAAFSALSVSCATNQANYFLPLPEVEAHVISGVPTENRTPSALPTKPLDRKTKSIAE